MDPLKPMKPMTGMAPMTPMAPMDFGPPWWPDDLGQPSSSGGQDGLRYAVFPAARRLLVEDGGRLTAYDAGGRQISGVSQGQGEPVGGPGRLLAFTAEDGPVELETLRAVD